MAFHKGPQFPMFKHASQIFFFDWGYKYYQDPTPKVFALFLGAFAQIWTQMSNDPTPNVYLPFLGDFASNLDTKC